MALSSHAPARFACDCVGSRTDSLIHEGKTLRCRRFFIAEAKACMPSLAAGDEIFGAGEERKPRDLA